MTNELPIVSDELSDEVAGEQTPRPMMRSMIRGFFCKCPSCDAAPLFGKFLKPVDVCKNCGTEIFHHRADDFPPYINITIVGHIVVAAVLIVERSTELTLLQHLAIWLPLTVFLAMILMQPIKGAVIGIQWAGRMFGFGNPEHTDEF